MRRDVRRWSASAVAVEVGGHRRQQRGSPLLVAESLAERAEIAALPAVRKATRDELYRRVHRARDFIHASLDAPLSLAQLARVAAMSTYHFHRAFRAIVGETPGRYVTERRLLAARRLLATTGRSVTDVCLDVGFSSHSHMTAAFREAFGAPPSAWRGRLRKPEKRALAELLERATQEVSSST